MWSVQEAAESSRFRPSGTQKPQWLDVSRSRTMLPAAFIPLAAMRMVTDSPRADRDNACLGCPARETARPIPRNTGPCSKRETFGICSGTFVTLPAIRSMLPLICDRKWQGTCSNCASSKTCRSSGRPVGSHVRQIRWSRISVAGFRSCLSCGQPVRCAQAGCRGRDAESARLARETARARHGCSSSRDATPLIDQANTG